MTSEQYHKDNNKEYYVLKMKRIRHTILNMSKIKLEI